MGSKTIELSNDEFDRLLIALGYATGAARQQHSDLADSFLRLANLINKDNPRWTPYKVEGLEQLRVCGVCKSWFLASRVDQVVCNKACRQKKYHLDPDIKRKRRELYAKNKGLTRPYTKRKTKAA
jgi:hypothetical protein